LTAIGISALALAAPASGDPAPALDFAGGDTTAIALAAGRTAGPLICNGTASRVVVHLLVQEFVFKRTPAYSGPVVRLPATLSIGARECRPARISVARYSLAGGTYSGSVVAVSRVGIARRTLVITAPGGAEAPVGAAETVTLEARHYPLSHHANLIGSTVIPLGPYPPGSSVTPLAGTIAVLQNGSHLAYLTVPPGTTALTAKAGFANLPVNLDGASKTGHYKGDVVFGVGPTATKVSIDVAVGDPIWMCVLALFAGIALAVVSALFAQRLFPERKLRLFEDGLKGSFAAAVEQYNEALGDGDDGGGGGDLSPLTINSGAALDYVAKIRTAFERYKQSTLLIDTESDEYKAISKLIDDAENDIAFLGDSDGLIKWMRELAEAIAKFPSGDPEPGVMAGARGLLTTRALGPGDATSLAASAAAYVEILKHWPRLWRRLVDDETWLTKLGAQPDAGTVTDRLRTIDGKLQQVRSELFGPVDSAGFDLPAIEQHLDWAEDGLWALRWLDQQPIERDMLGVVASELAYRPTFRAEVTALPALHVIDVARRAVAAPQIRAEVSQIAGRAVGPASYTLVTLLALSGSLATGLTTLYTDTFGSFTNYVTAVGVGGATGIGAKAILDGIGSLRKVGRSAILPAWNSRATGTASRSSRLRRT
jgi:hypothetical protein